MQQASSLKWASEAPGVEKILSGPWISKDVVHRALHA